jgi:hypothetical protein
MGKKQPTPPAPPDPYATAKAQTGSNVQTGIANAYLGNVNEYGPYGSVVYKPSNYHYVGQGTHPGSPPKPGAGYLDTSGSLGGPGGLAGKLLGRGTGGAEGNPDDGYWVPQFDRITTLSPEQQRLYDQQTRLGEMLNGLAIDQTGRLSDHLGRPIDASGLPQRGALSGNDFSADRGRVEQAMFERLNPQLDRDRAALETTLVNQ